MTKTELWDALKARNPQFETGPINFTPQSLKKFFDLVWDKSSEETHTETNPLNVTDFFRKMGAL